MFDFPNSPVLDQTYVVGEKTYKWNGYAWIPQAVTGGGGDVSSALTLTAGAGLAGGGDLTQSRSFDVGQGQGLVVGADSVALEVPVTAARGGTGQTTYAVGDLLYASTALSLDKLADISAGNVLLSGGIGAPPTYGKVNLAAGGHVTGNLPIGNLAGGTNASSTTFWAGDGSWKTAGGSGVASGISFTPTGTVAANNVQTAIAELDTEKLALLGGTMTGHIALPTGPAATNAVRKDYVDGAISAIDLTGKVSKTGDTMSGHLTLPGSVPAANQAIYKQYVDDGDAANVALAAGKVAKAGDTMTGDLTISKTQPELHLDRAVGANRCLIVGKVNSLKRWELNIAGTLAESGSNVGSPFFINSYDDAGNFLATPFQIHREQNRVQLAGDPISSTHATTKNYVDVADTANTTLANGKVSKTGYDVMTGPLSITTDDPLFFLNKTPGSHAAFIQGQVNGSPRWNIMVGDYGAESGSNAGTDFQIQRKADDGTHLGVPFTISRATGHVLLEVEPIAGLHAVTKTYVDVTFPATTRSWTGIQSYPEVALTMAGTTSWTLATAPNATLQLSGGNTTLTFPLSPVPGQVYTLRVTQDTTPRSIAWATPHFKWAGGAANVPVISIASGAVDHFTFIASADYCLHEIGRAQGIA